MILLWWGGRLLSCWFRCSLLSSGELRAPHTEPLWAFLLKNKETEWIRWMRLQTFPKRQITWWCTICQITTTSTQLGMHRSNNYIGYSIAGSGISNNRAKHLCLCTALCVSRPPPPHTHTHTGSQAKLQPGAVWKSQKTVTKPVGLNGENH